MHYEQWWANPNLDLDLDREHSKRDHCKVLKVGTVSVLFSVLFGHTKDLKCDITISFLLSCQVCHAGLTHHKEYLCQSILDTVIILMQPDMTSCNSNYGIVSVGLPLSR